MPSFKPCCGVAKARTHFCTSRIHSGRWLLLRCLTAVAEPDSRDSGGRAKEAAERVLLVEPAAAAGDEGGPDPRLGAGGAPARCRASAAPSSRSGSGERGGGSMGVLRGAHRFSQLDNADFGTSTIQRRIFLRFILHDLSSTRARLSDAQGWSDLSPPYARPERSGSIFKVR